MPAKIANPLGVAVDSLKGKTPDQIAEMIRKSKIKGRPGTVSGCPIASLMHVLFGGQFIVGRKKIMRRGGGGGANVDSLPTPKCVSDFIRKFDLSMYPSLIAPPPRVLIEHKKATRHKPWRSGKHKKRGKNVNNFAKEVGR